jgi:hypothetical protein
VPGEVLDYLRALYDGEILFLDAQLERLFAALEPQPGSPGTLVVVTSDHGEEFKEHGSLGHALTLYREQSHVPLILNDPASEFRGTQVSAAVRHVDIAPTLAEIARLDPADPFVSGLTGMPLTRHLGAEPRPEPLPVVVESTRWGPRRSAVSLGGRKAIAPMTYRWWFARPGREGSWTAPWVRGLELYDVDADPGETRRLASAPGDPALARLAAWREQAWRGVHLTLQLAPEWEGELRLDPATVWADEPRLEDELRLHPLELAGGRIALSGRAARPLRLLLPVDPASAGSLEIHSLRGDLAVFDGSDWRTIEAGSIETLDLAGLPVDAAPPPRLPDGSSAVLRVRRLAPRERLVVDEKTRQLLEDLGYGR